VPPAGRAADTAGNACHPKAFEGVRAWSNSPPEESRLTMPVAPRPELALPGGLPWWTYLVVALACLGVYICRILVLYKIGSKALDKVSRDRVPEVVDSLTGYRRPSPGAGKSSARTMRAGRRRAVGQQLKQASESADPDPGAS